MTSIVLWCGLVVASAAGACGRFVIDGEVTQRLGARMPLGTAAVNLSGAFAAGVLAGLAVGHGVALVVGLGFLGSYTTFSTWMLETLMLRSAGRSRAAWAHALGLLVLGLAAAAAGWAVGAFL